MGRKVSLKIRYFLVEIPLLDDEFDEISREVLDIVIAQSEFNDMEHKISMLN